MSENSTVDKARYRLEVYNTVLLAIATLVVAWCSYQGSLWSGIQTFRLAESNKYGRLAQQKLIQSGQNKAMEEAVIIEFVNAAYTRDEGKVNYILRGVRPQLAAILSAWLQKRPFQNSAAPKHPMVMPEYESLMKGQVAESEKMSRRGEEQFDLAQQANLISDEYCFLNVLFSAVMFLGAITTKLVRNRTRIFLSIVSLIMCVGGLIVVFLQMPVAHKG